MPNTVTSTQEPKKRVLFRYFFNAFHEKSGNGGGYFYEMVFVLLPKDNASDVQNDLP